MTRGAYSPLLCKSNTGSGWAQSKTSKIETSWIIGTPKNHFYRNLRNRLAPYSFSPLEYVILIRIHTTNAQIYSFQLSESTVLHQYFWGDFFEKKYEKMMNPKSVQIHSQKVPGASGDQKTSLNDSQSIFLASQMLYKSNTGSGRAQS